MPWRHCLALLPLLATFVLRADDSSIWREYGLVHASTSQQGKLDITSYQLKDATGALAAWEWLRSPQGRTCSLADLCSQDGRRTLVSDANYVLLLNGPKPSKEQVQALFKEQPDKRPGVWSALLTFLPRQDLLPGTARYILGPDSLRTFVPELASSHPGFDEGAEAQLAEYRLKGQTAPARLILFNYPSPEMARIHAAQFAKLSNIQAKRSDVLVAIVLNPPSPSVADTLLSRIQYQAKIVWDDVPPPSPIKPLYQLLQNIIYLSILLSALCLTAGLMYAAMRIYRRRYGTLDADEAMTTLHLTGD